jgi:polysaccharide deacetylase family protein (PEP-CTERM system associated)
MSNDRQATVVAHAITVDVEDWFHVCGAEQAAGDLSGQGRVLHTTSLVLDLLRSCGVRGTFFVLGSVASRHPELAPLIVDAGHELASHGWSHRLVTALSAQEFADELLRTADLLEQQTGKRPEGFRAPRWSLSRQRTPWAFEILAQQGYRYDSSLTPLALIGDPSGPLLPHRIETAAGTLWEIPPLVTATPLGNLPTGGGWGFRFFPSAIIRHSLRACQRQGGSGVLFIHPRELDPDGPRLRLGLLREFATYGPRNSAAGRLAALMRSFSFLPLGEQVSTWQTAS